MTTTNEQAKVYRALLKQEVGGSVGGTDRMEVEAHVDDWENAKELFENYFEGVLEWEGFTIEEVRKVDEIDPTQLRYRQLHDCEDGALLHEEEVN